MPDRLDFAIKPLTPIFTGGLDGKCDHLHVSGIIGSLRWWFESLVRGMGGTACDPSTHECMDGNYCDTCLIFGATGLKRIFRLEMEHYKNSDYGKRLPQIKIVEKHDPHINRGRHHGWFLDPGMTGELKGTIYYPLRPLSLGLCSENLGQMLMLTLSLASRWGGLGAGTSKGYGVCNLDQTVQNMEAALEGMEKLTNGKQRPVAARSHYPTLNEFFFAKFRFDPGEPKQFLTGPPLKRIFFPREWGALSYYTSKGIIPISLLLRYHLRRLVAENYPNNRDLRHRLMGEVWGNKRQKSLINISHAYAVTKNENSYEFRIWGWIPQDLARGVQRQMFLEQLQQWTAPGGELWQKCKMEIDNSYYRWFDMQDGSIVQNLNNLLNGGGRGQDAKRVHSF